MSLSRNLMLIAINIKEGLGRSCADDKAPGDLIPQMQALNLLGNKIICST